MPRLFRRRLDGIKLKTSAEIEEMKAAGHLSAQALRVAGSFMRPGVSTAQIDKAIESYIREHGAKPTFKGYGGFPAAACISVNERVVHGIPDDATILHEGDIVSVDTGATFGGWVGDNAYTFRVGSVSPEAELLCATTEQALEAGVAAAQPGNRLGDVGAAVQAVAEARGFGVVRDYVGHGVGHVMHEEPQVPNYGKRGRGTKLVPGMVIAIEPMVTAGDYRVHGIADGWGVVTDDGSLAAHFERTIAITKEGPVVLTDW